MDRAEIEGHAVEPDDTSEEDELLARHGDAHERRVLEEMKADRSVVEIDKELPFEAAHHLTLEAMKRGEAVIYRAALRRDRFEGWADFLVRVDRSSRLGAFSYEVIDTKLAINIRPYFLLQLCAYADMLEAIQGVLPEHIIVLDGRRDRIEFRTDEFFSYYLRVKEEFLAAQAAWSIHEQPVPEARADHGRWQGHAEAVLEELDHPSLVAGITALQVKRLADAGITTLTELARTKLTRVPRLDDATFERLKAQARLQLGSRNRERPSYEIVEHSPNERRGLAMLPPPSPLDVYFDMEGYPLFEDGEGLEYLFGVAHGELLRYCDLWAHDRSEEKRKFEALIDWVVARWRRDPSLHVYHYGTYEVSALRHLMGRHATRENELDALLRGSVFVDLYRIVKQGVRVGEGSYSLKRVEKLYRAKRTEDVATAGDSIVEYARWRDAPDAPDAKSSKILRRIREYNRADCRSTAELAAWLRDRQTEHAIAHVAPGAAEERSTSSTSSERAPREDEQLSRALLEMLPDDRTSDPERWRIHEMLAYLVTLHRREDKPMWWTYFDRIEMTEEELIEDPDCLGGLVRTGMPPIPDKRSFLYEYTFDPDQETKIAAGDDCQIVGEQKIRVHELDRDEGRAVLKRSADRSAPPDRVSLVPKEYVDPKVIVASIGRVARRYAASRELPPALADFLHRHPPRIRGHERGSPILDPSKDLGDQVIDLVARLDRTTLAIQGPPGSGKSTTAARAIVALLASNQRVGITANSHEVIDGLMRKVLEHATERGVEVIAAKVQSRDRSEPSRGVKAFDKMAQVGARYQLVGGTAWAFSDPSAEDAFDYLFVDEAGQVSLANFVGMSPAAKNLVLIGDQRQLAQPTKGAHPGETGQSALQYFLENHATIPDHLGVFLSRTHRLHPDICAFISSAFYEGRLQHTDEAARRRVEAPSGATRIREETGIVFVPVEHEGNGRASEEEVDMIRALVGELVGRTFESSDGTRPLTQDDILIVAPYNMQVRALKSAIPGARIGTVDKFQGKEAPVVIVSMCASSAETSPRGMEFLFSPHRINVAISRAQCLAIVVGNPALARARANSVRQMRLVNLFCRMSQLRPEKLRSSS